MKKTPNYPHYKAAEFKDFRELTEISAERYGDKLAYSYKEKRTDKELKTRTFIEVRDECRALGTEVIELGLKGEKAAIVGANCYGWIISYYSLMAAGAVTVPIDAKLPAQDIIGIVNKSKCTAVFYTANIAEKVGEIRENCPTVKYFVAIKGNPAENDRTISELIESGKKLLDDGNTEYLDAEIDPDKLASIVFTSGTTGKGKGVMLTQGNIARDIVQAMYNFKVSPKTVAVLPFHHTFGSTINVVAHLALGSHVYISGGIKYFAAEMKEQQPTHLILVPLFVETLYKKIWATAEQNGKTGALKAMIKFSNALRKVGIDRRRYLFSSSIHSVFGGKLEFIICGGAKLNTDIIDFFDSIGITILNGYGITECSPLISCNRNEYQKYGSVGVPIVGEEVKIADPDENGEGEICVKGVNVMLGYYEDPDATSAAFDEEGYFKTGDYGKLDGDGWIYITGRLKNLIIFSNGKNVYPEEIESEISKIPGVNEVVVYAGESVSNPEREVIVAEIFPDTDVLKSRGIEDAKLYFNEAIKDVNARTVSYKAVGYVKLREEEFPKNTSQKILRFGLDKTIE